MNYDIVKSIDKASPSCHGLAKLLKSGSWLLIFHCLESDDKPIQKTPIQI